MTVFPYQHYYFTLLYDTQLYPNLSFITCSTLVSLLVEMTSFGMSSLGREIEAVLKGFRKGAEYGSKVRFVHTLVMTLLFKDIHLNRFPILLKTILKMAIEHGRNLGLFVLSFKAGSKLLNRLWGEKPGNHFLSGLFFGTLVFGNKTGVNNQIVLYLLSRVLIGLLALLYRSLSTKWKWIEKGYGYYLLGALCWGTVMWLFQKENSLLQPSLTHSMNFLYKQSNYVNGWTDLIPYYPSQKSVVKEVSKGVKQKVSRKQ